MNDAPPLPPEPPAGYPPSRPRASGPNLWLWGCVGLPAGLILLSGVLAFSGWRSFVSYGIASDLTKYHADLRQSDLTSEEKRPRLERIERLRERARGAPISFWRWLDYDSSLKSIFDDGKVTPEELEMLDHELERMEKEFR